MVDILDDLSYFFVNIAWGIFGDSMHSFYSDEISPY